MVPHHSEMLTKLGAYTEIHSSTVQFFINFQTQLIVATKSPSNGIPCIYTTVTEFIQSMDATVIHLRVYTNH
jgi:hypothetical protein